MSTFVFWFAFLYGAGWLFCFLLGFNDYSSRYSSSDDRRDGARLMWLSPIWLLLLLRAIAYEIPEAWRTVWGKDNDQRN